MRSDRHRRRQIVITEPDEGPLISGRDWLVILALCVAVVGGMWAVAYFTA